MFRGVIAYSNPEKCTGCNLCVRRCPGRAIEIFDKKAVVIDFLCLGCLLCMYVCPSGAITTRPRYVVKSEEEKLRIQGALIKRQIKVIKEKLG